MKTLLFLFLFALALQATQIYDPNVRDSSGRLITIGTIKACPPSSATGGGGAYWVSADCISITIRNGLVNVKLLPGPYLAHWETPATSDTKWLVPDSTTSKTIPEITVTGPTYPLSWSKLTNTQWTSMTNSQWTSMTN